MDNEYTSWLLDLYTHPRDGLVLWMLCNDTHRRRFRQDFPVTFYAAGPGQRLRALWKALRNQPIEVELAREEQRDLFSGSTTVSAARVCQPYRQPGLFRQVARQLPDLNFYNADISINLHHAVAYDTFPLARCHIQSGGAGNITQLEIQDSPWKLHSRPPPLRLLTIEPETDPLDASPTRLYLCTALGRFSIPLQPRQTLLRTLQGVSAALRPRPAADRLGRYLVAAEVVGMGRKLQYAPVPQSRTGHGRRPP